MDTDVYAMLIRELRKLGVTTIVDTDGEPLRHAVRAEPTVISPNVNEAEELVGHEFNDDEDMLFAIREMGELGPREAIMTTPDGCFACLRDRARRRGCCARGSSRASRSRPSARATRSSPGFVAARYDGPLAGGVPALRRRVRRGVDPAPGRRAHRPARGRAAARRGRGRAVAEAATA